MFFNALHADYNGLFQKLRGTPLKKTSIFLVKLGEFPGLSFVFKKNGNSKNAPQNWEISVLVLIMGKKIEIKKRVCQSLYQNNQNLGNSHVFFTLVMEKGIIFWKFPIRNVCKIFLIPMSSFGVCV